MSNKAPTLTEPLPLVFAPLILDDLTPNDLLEAGWSIVPFFDVPDVYTACHALPGGGQEWMGGWRNVEALIELVRVNKIAKLPWTQGHKDADLWLPGQKEGKHKSGV